LTGGYRPAAHEIGAVQLKSNDAQIIIVYQEEPHAGQMAFAKLAQPESFEARRALAKRVQDEYELPRTILVDTMEDQSRTLFSDLASPVFIMDTSGAIVAKSLWADRPQIGLAIKALVHPATLPGG